MNTSQVLQLLGGAFAAFLLIPILVRLMRTLAVEVEHEHAVLITRFGQLVHTITKPGWHWLPQRILPWVRVHRASLQRDFQHYRDIHVNDARGTTMRVDLWLELRITDPKKALFEVAEWERSLQNLVQHAAIAILGSREFQQILTDRIEIGELLKRDIGAETTRWGVSIEQVFVRNVSLLPEVSRQIFETIAARLERAKAAIEEDGRLRAAQHEAHISLQVAGLVADAKGQYPAALSRAFADMGREAAVLAAYHELYELSLVRPHRTITFTGFGEGELGAAEAMMIVPPLGSESALPGPGLPPLGAHTEHVLRSGVPGGLSHLNGRSPRVEKPS